MKSKRLKSGIPVVISVSAQNFHSFGRPDNHRPHIGEGSVADTETAHDFPVVGCQHLFRNQLKWYFQRNVVLIY